MLLYVGVTDNLPQRQAAHRAEKWWWSLVHHIDVDPAASELAEAVAGALELVVARQRSEA